VATNPLTLPQLPLPWFCLDFGKPCIFEKKPNYFAFFQILASNSFPNSKSFPPKSMLQNLPSTSPLMFDQPSLPCPYLEINKLGVYGKLIS